MSAANTTIHGALRDQMASILAAGKFRLTALGDPRGLAWAVCGDTSAPDQLAAVPALLARAFADRQPLLRFFSPNSMRFEYYSDALHFIRNGIEGDTEGSSFLLDVPNDKETTDFVVAWTEGTYLVVRRIMVAGEAWSLVGIGADPTTGRNALRSAAPQIIPWLENLGADAIAAAAAPAGLDATLHDKMISSLQSFRDVTPGIQMAAVTSKDGFVVAALADGTLDAEMVAPLMGHSFLAIQESTQRLCGATESVMLRMEQGILMGRELADGLLFAALLEPSACSGLVLSAFETTATALRTALDSMSSALKDPTNIEVAA